MRLRKSTIESQTEEKILTALIVSDTFCRDFSPLINKEIFVVDFIARVAMWCKSYFHKYKKAPGKHIQDIYETEKQNISNDDEREAVANLLTKLSEDYELSEFNEEYLSDKARNYFRERSIRLSTEKASALLEVGKVEEAETILQRYKKVNTAFIGWENPLEESVIKNWFQDENSQKDILFKLPGDIGKFIGYFQRNWLVSFLAPVKRGKCIAEGSEIVLPSGEVKNIEDVVKDKDKEILSINGEGKIITTSISNHYNNGIKDVFEVVTRSGRRVQTTINHPFLTIEGWKNLEDINVGEEIAIINKYNNIFGNEEWPAYQLRLLGYLIADGGLTGGSPTFTKADKELVKDFYKCVELMGDSVSKAKSSDIDYRISKGGENKYRGGNSNTRQWLYDLGIGKCKSNQKEIPKSIFKLNKKSLSIFLSALFSGDGTIYKEKNGAIIEYCSANKKMVYQIQHLLMRFGIFSTLKENKKLENYACLYIKKREQIECFLKEIGFLHKKKQIAETILNSFPKQNGLGRQYTSCYSYEFCKNIIWPEIEKYRNVTPIRQRKTIKEIGVLRDNLKNGKSGATKYLIRSIADQINSDKLKSILDADIFFDRIIAINYLGKKQTYDLTVPETHCFIANDMVVHNTWFLLEIAINGVLSRKRTLVISLEMDKHRVYKRLYKRITAMADETKEYIMPVFDCKLNQENTCEKPERKNKIRLLDDMGKKPKHFERGLKYRPCTYCRGSKWFQPETWFTITKREELKQGKAVKKISAVAKQFGSKIRVIKYPTKTANVTRIRSDIQALEENEGFVPDLIVIDYADIIGKEDSRETGREAINSIWEALKGMTDSLHCCVVTASQSNRAGFERDNVTQTNASEDIRKMAHADIWFGINQTPEEKRASRVRISKIAVRDGDFDQYESVIVTQQLATGQVILDSHLVRSQFEIEQEGIILDNL